MTELKNTSAAIRKCVGCGAELSASAPRDLCPKCLLKLAMETQPVAGPGGTIVLAGTRAEIRGLPQPGEQLGHYSIVRALGAGGMGAVYEAEDLESGRRVALKVLSHRLDSPDARERFFREGRLAASINHPNSVYIFGTEEIGGTPVIAMELVSGGTLQDRVHARGPLPIGEAVDCMLQVIEGLKEAQRIGILHRDIKPSNCFVGEDGTVKVGDFGLSISTAVRTEPALTATGTFVGTPAFCSPEQLRGDELNARSDMYSVGATLFYLLTGRTPFDAPNTVRLLATVLEQPAPSPRKLRPEIPQGLAKAVLRCLEKQPEERFKSYADLARMLVPYSSTAPTPATLGLRFVAGMVDMVLMGTLALSINLSAFGSPMAFMAQAMRPSPKVVVCLLGWVCVVTLYYGLCEGLWGAAVGKSLCRLRLVGPDRNPPGFKPAWLRALMFAVLPLMPYWLTFAANPQAYLTSPFLQLVLGFSIYGVIALLFVTARRRNGFAAVQDLLTGTRVVTRSALSMRPALPARELPSPAGDSAVTIGPYHVLHTLSESAREHWLLAYDVKLLRKVWLRVVPTGTPPVPVPLRLLGRIGRLRWLTGRRSPEANWDAFEALTGEPFLELVRRPQAWGELRYWLHDLATEITAAEKDHTLPELALDRLWITGEGRAKLLDFPAPGLSAKSEPGLAGEPQAAQGFLGQVAATALQGTERASAMAVGEVAVPLPLHARAFLKSLPLMAGAEAVIGALKPLLSRVASVTRARRATLVAGCLIFPVLACFVGIFGVSYVRELTQKNPGLMDLTTLLQMRSTARLWISKDSRLPTDHQLAIYIAHHYRGWVTNATSWSNPMVLAMIKADGRTFAEQSVAQNPAPTQAEIADADQAVSPFLPKQPPFGGKPQPALPVMVLAASLLFYVCLPALVAALLFRGGLVLLIAGVTYVKRDGVRASRLRLLWRAFVACCPSALVFLMSMVALIKHLVWEPWLVLALFGLLAVWSVALPGRGLQDRLAGTWPVPR